MKRCFGLAFALAVACGGSSNTDFYGPSSGTSSSGGNGAGGADSGGSVGLGAQAGTSAGGLGASAGTGGSAGTIGSGGETSAGAPGNAGAGGDLGGQGGAGGANDCAGPEICDGVDNDCDGEAEVEGDGVCPDGCKGGVRDGHHYIFCDADVTWDQARTACQDYGSTFDLVVIESEAENDWIITQAAAIGDELYIGATDGAIEGQWRWVNGTRFFQDDESGGMAVASHYTNWLPSGTQPNDTGGDEECAVLVPNVDGWNDIKCDDESLNMSYVCETK